MKSLHLNAASTIGLDAARSQARDNNFPTKLNVPTIHVSIPLVDGLAPNGDVTSPVVVLAKYFVGVWLLLGNSR